MLVRENLLSCDVVTELAFSFKKYDFETGACAKFGVELTPRHLNKSPYFSAKDFKMYIEHERIKGEMVLICNKDMKDLFSKFGVNANYIICFFHNLKGGMEVCTLSLDNLDMYEMHNFEKVGDVHMAIMRFVMKGVRKPGKKIFEISRTSKFWGKQMKVKFHE